MPKDRGPGIHLWFSPEHTSKSNPEPHIDANRQIGTDVVKTDHIPVSPGYGNTPVNIPVRVDNSSSNDKR